MNTNIKYTALSSAEKLALTSGELDRAIQIEAAERGVVIPITLDEALRGSEFQYLRHQIPAEAVAFYEIVAPTGYSRNESGVFYRTEAEAERALEGACRIYEDGYGATKRLKIAQGDFSVQKKWLSVSKGEQLVKALSTLEQDLGAYEELVKEIHDDLAGLRQAKYNDGVRTAKRDKFLELAGGDVEIAKRFWSNTESAAWPEA